MLAQSGGKGSRTKQMWQCALTRPRLGGRSFQSTSWKLTMNNNNSLLRHIPWLALAVIGACALGVVALRRGEAINALWIVVAAVAIYLVAYRYYSLFIATKVMQLGPAPRSGSARRWQMRTPHAPSQNRRSSAPGTGQSHGVHPRKAPGSTPPLFASEPG